MTLARYEIGLAGLDIGEEEVSAIREVLFSGVLTNGPATKRFEEAFASAHRAREAVAFANGTVALSALYIALGIGPGDEVIVPSMTFISSATSVIHVGAAVVFAEIDPDTFNIDVADVERRITPRTRAILAVHYGGQAADLDELRTVADKAGVHLLEDAAEAHGATYRGRPVGAIGTAGMFSFTPTKNITTGEGGIITSNDTALADRLRLLRNHGQTSTYRHELLGYNWRMTEMQAAMGCVQLSKLPAILERKRANALRMADRLQGLERIRVPLEKPDREHVYMLYTLTVDGDRDGAMRELQERGIESRVYFPPAHTQPVFAGYRASLPVTEAVGAKMLSIPFHSRLTEHELDRIATAVAGVFSA